MGKRKRNHNISGLQNQGTGTLQAALHDPVVNSVRLRMRTGNLARAVYIRCVRNRAYLLHIILLFLCGHFVLYILSSTLLRATELRHYPALIV